VGLTNSASAETQKQIWPNRLSNKKKKTGAWLVYSRSRGCKKEAAQVGANDMRPGVTTLQSSNNQQQHYVDLEKEKTDNNHNKTFEEVAPVQNERQIENGEATSTNKGVNIDQKQKATYQWNMAKELGVTTGTEHDRVIDRIRVMEKRDRTKAERLENKNIIP